MTLRAGSYDAVRPVFRGVLREDSYPAYTCTHWNHANQQEASKCSKDALAQLRSEGALPAGWEQYDQRVHKLRAR